MDATIPMTVVEHASGYGRWTLVRRRPAAALAPFVREYQGYVEEAGRPVVRRELPSGTVPMIVNFGPAFTLHDASPHDTSPQGPGAPDRPRALSTSFVAGLDERASLVGSTGTAFCMQVNFTPTGALRFLGVPMDEIACRVVDLDAILGTLAGRLAERLHDASGWPERFAILDAAIAERFARTRRPGPLAAAAWAVLEAEAGAVAIGDLAERFGCSRKHLNERFRREIGLPAKTAARLLRFERAVAALQAGTVRSLAELAAECGYYDQAHLNRDFRAFAGESPTRLAARMLPDGTGVIAETDGW